MHALYGPWIMENMKEVGTELAGITSAFQFPLQKKKNLMKYDMWSSALFLFNRIFRFVRVNGTSAIHDRLLCCTITDMKIRVSYQIRYMMIY
jgi:hypothetical protein